MTAILLALGSSVGYGVSDFLAMAPVALLTVLNLSADAFLAPVVTALLAHALTAERPGARELAGAALAVLRHPGRVRRPGGRLAVQSSVDTAQEGPSMAKLTEGAQAPTFTLPDQDGNPVSLDDFKGAKVLVYFYPADDTPGCTKEACQFNDNLAGFQAAGVPVIGVSPDDGASHQRFRNKYGLQFPLLTDADHQVMDAYGAWGKKTRYGQASIGVLRSTFLVDEQGRIERAWHNVKADGHATQVLEALGPKV